MLLIFQGAGVVIILLAGGLAPGLMENSWFLMAANTLPLYLFGVPVYLLILRTVPNGPVAARYRPPLGVLRFALVMVCCLGVSYALNLVMNTLLTLLQMLVNPDTALSNSLQELVLAGGPLPSLVFAVLLPAVGEEFLFRHMLWKKLRGGGELTYILFSALCFGLFHGNLIQLPYTFAIGAVLGWLYVVFGRLWLPMLAHFIVNLLGAVVLPWVMERYPDLAVLYSLGVVVFFVPAGIALFFVYRRRAVAALLPAAEPGWPPPAPRRRASLYEPWQPAGWPAPPAGAPVYPVTAGQPAPGTAPMAGAGGVPGVYTAPAGHAGAPVPGFGYPAPEKPAAARSPGGLPVAAGWPPPRADAGTPPQAPAAQPCPGGANGTAGVRQAAGIYPVPGQYTAAAYLPPPPRPGLRGMAGVCLANVGMVLFMAFSGLLNIFSLVTMLGLMA